jgi:replicative DNA helicase
MISDVEKLIIKGVMQSKDYLALVSNSFLKEYFDDDVSGRVFDVAARHFKQYGNIIPKDTIGIQIEKDFSTIENANDIVNFFEEIDSIDFDIAKNYSYLVNTTNEYLKEKAIKKAILESVEIINKKSELGKIKSIIEDALCRDLNIDMGLNYFGNFKERIQKILVTPDIRIPTFFPQLDEYINGGFPIFTLSVITAKIHGWKSAFITNLAARQALNGYNVVVLSLEMSEIAYAQRFDSLYSKIDINKIHSNKQAMTNMMREIVKIKENPKLGQLYIKQFPTGQASVLDFSKYLRELRMRGAAPHIVYIDYINLVKPSSGAKKDLYADVKGISEEFRAMSYEFQVPVVSVTQLNREGAQVSFDEVDFTYVSESIGVPATADFMMIFGHDTEKAVYESEIQYKIVKNRLGGRVGEISKFYYDARTLKMYDSLELDMWSDDAEITGDDRKVQAVVEHTQAARGDRTKRYKLRK